MSNTPTARFEAKYLLDYFQYYRVKNALSVFCKRDKFSQINRGGRYLVRSLYFDSPDYKAYVEKVVGENKRNKLRIRSYFSTRSETKFLSVEEKRRYGKLIVKPSTHASLEQYDRFMETGRWDAPDDDVLQDFEKQIRLNHLAPVVVVEYMREAYFARDRSGVRFSFDHDIHYARSDSLFCDRTLYKRDLTHNIVFEIKTAKDDISWVSQLVRDHDLGAVPNSKYVNAIDLTRQPIWY